MLAERAQEIPNLTRRRVSKYDNDNVVQRSLARFPARIVSDLDMDASATSTLRQFMAHDINLYATLYVDSECRRDDLNKLLSQIPGARLDNGDVACGAVVLTVLDNDDYRPADKRREAAFLFYRYRVEVDPLEDASRQAVTEIVSCVLETLWHSGAAAVASCEYEDALPRHGGIAH